MKVYVESCWGGGSKFYFRIHDPRNPSSRHFVLGDNWTREVATEALNELERSGLKRRNIRFILH